MVSSIKKEWCRSQLLFIYKGHEELSTVIATEMPPSPWWQSINITLKRREPCVEDIGGGDNLRDIVGCVIVTVTIGCDLLWISSIV